MLESAAAQIQELLNTSRPIDHAIIESRLKLPVSRTLLEIGHEFGVTRERIRQIEVTLKNRFARCISDPAAVIAVIENDLGDVVKLREFERYVFERAGIASIDVSRLLARVLYDVSAYKLTDNFLVSERTSDTIQSLRKTAKSLSDDCGIFSAERAKTQLPENLRTHWSWFISRCQFRVIHGQLALRETNRAKIKAAMLSLNRPATRPELAEMCGLTNKVASGTLSNIPSIIRTTRTHWALRSWGLHEYKGIVDEMVAWIEEEGGIGNVNELTHHMAARFNVNHNSVMAYAQTAKFEIFQGTIRISTQKFRHMKPLREVIHGYDELGRAYWTFVVHERYFRGYSVVGVPVEFASALGCPADDSIHLTIRNIFKCHDLTVQWHLASTTKASIGYLRDALECLNLQPGEIARVTLVARGVVEFSRESASSGIAAQNTSSMIRKRPNAGQFDAE